MSDTFPIPEASLREIAQAIREQSCVPFLGSGVSAKTDSEDGFPIGSSLAQRMYEELVQRGCNGNIANPNDLLEVSTHYQHHLERFRLLRFIQSNIPDRDTRPLTAHRMLAKLPFGVFITTNYDTLMEKALDDEDKKPKKVVQPREGFKDLASTVALFRVKEPIVYKMHGCLSDMDDDVVGAGPGDNFIITEDDYLEFLYSMHGREYSIPSRITAEFATSMLLFLGYALEDVDFKVLYKIVEKFPASKRWPSYAIQRSSSDFSREYWRRKGVQIYNCDVHEFVSALAQVYFS